MGETIKAGDLVVWGVTRFEAVDRSGAAIFDVTAGCKTVSFTSIDRVKRTVAYDDISIADAAARIRVLDSMVAAGIWTKTTQHG